MMLRLQNLPALLDRTQRCAAVAPAQQVVGVGAPHGGVLQHIQNAVVAGRSPQDHARGVIPHRQLDAPLPQQHRRPPRRPGLPERLEHRQDRPLHALVRVLADRLSTALEGGRHAPVQRSAQRLVAPATLHPCPMDRQIRGRHGPLEAQHQLIIGALRQVHIAVLNDRHVVHAAQVQQLKPLDRIARQARHLDPEHTPDLIQRNQPAQLVEPAARPLPPRAVPLVAVNRPHPVPAPAHLHGPLHQPVLAGLRLPVGEHLPRRRLAHVDHPQATQLPRPDLRAHPSSPSSPSAPSSSPVPPPSVSDAQAALSAIVASVLRARADPAATVSGTP